MKKPISVSLNPDIVELIDHIVKNSTLNFTSRPDLIKATVREYYKQNVDKFFPPIEKKKK